jgi:hypothetical protein
MAPEEKSIPVKHLSKQSFAKLKKNCASPHVPHGNSENFGFPCPDEFTGTPTDTDEATPVWTTLDAIPYQRMWEDDRFWLPYVISEESFLGRFAFEGEMMIWKEIITDISW